MARAEERKKAGNEMFSKGKLEAAIEAYSEAICFAPSEPVYYTNRAMCHRKKEAWDAVLVDCRHALQLDDTSIKGHYLLGVALDAQSQFAEVHLSQQSSVRAVAAGRFAPGLRTAFFGVLRRRRGTSSAHSSSARIGRSRTKKTSSARCSLRAGGSGRRRNPHRTCSLGRRARWSPAC